MNRYVKKTKPALWNTFGLGKAQIHRQTLETRPAKPQARQRAVRRRSKRMTSIMAQYRKQKGVFLATHPWCQVYGKPNLATQIHHSRGRSGTLLLDERFWLAVCPSAHDFIHRDPAAARANGYLCALGEWNKPPASQ